MDIKELKDFTESDKEIALRFYRVGIVEATAIMLEALEENDIEVPGELGTKVKWLYYTVQNENN